MEVVVPMAPGQDFHFQSASSSPYVSAPSSPKPFGNPSDHYFYASAPTSPSRTAAIYAHFFDWEDKSSRPKPDGDEDVEEEFDFAFGFDKQLQKKGPSTNLAAADELFENGRLRPLKPPPHLQRPMKDDRSGRTSQGGGLRSPQVVLGEVIKHRGRTPSTTLSTTSARSRRGSRSLSPNRKDEDFHKSLASSSAAASSSSSSTATTTSLIKGGGFKKWKLKDLLLFRSASEGRVMGRGSKDPLRKYTRLPSFSKKRRSGREDVRNAASSKAADKNGSARRGSSQAVSAHEMHYTMNRAASEELKKKTPLPFQRHGLFGCLSFNPAIHSITRGFSSHSFSRGRS